MLKVSGRVDGEATVFIQDEQVVLGDNFNFETIIDLERGLNEIYIQAERRYSRRAVIIRTVVFDPQEDSN